MVRVGLVQGVRAKSILACPDAGRFLTPPPPPRDRAPAGTGATGWASACPSLGNFVFRSLKSTAPQR